MDALLFDLNGLIAALPYLYNGLYSNNLIVVELSIIITIIV
jgi:hypothetical protein